MVLMLKVPTIKNGWESLVKRIMKDGVEITDERGSVTKEILNTMVNIKNPTDSESPKGYFWTGEKLDKYSEQFLSSDKQGFIYTYGNRLRAHFDGIDQIQEAIGRLNNFKESRRAISVTWDPTVDTKNDEVPCMMLVDFKIRDGKLYTTGLWRSHDIYGAWFPNAVGLSNLTKYVAGEVGSEIGSLTIHSISAHIYEVNFDEAKRV
ncbi:MAG: thymidylate synthase [Methanobacterium sp.]|uniref:thymidylate synthase n=1 Tax=Methanobacterium sp. TaxID=2164 RepID=UPI003C7774D6